jgi:hypothetical protein
MEWKTPFFFFHTKIIIMSFIWAILLLGNFQFVNAMEDDKQQQPTTTQNILEVQSENGL